METRQFPSHPEAHRSHEVLAAVAGEAEIAALHARVDDLEGEVERLRTRVEASERRRDGEAELLRARFEDGLGALESLAREQRDWIARLEQRLAGRVVRAVEAAVNRRLAG